MSASVSINEKDGLGAATCADDGGGDSLLTVVLGLGLSLAAAALAAMEVPGFFEADTSVENTPVAGFDGATIVPFGFPGAKFDVPLTTGSEVFPLDTAASARLRSAAWRASGFEACTIGRELDGAAGRFVAGGLAPSVSLGRLT